MVDIRIILETMSSSPFLLPDSKKGKKVDTPNIDQKEKVYK